MVDLKDYFHVCISSRNVSWNSLHSFDSLKFSGDFNAMLIRKPSLNLHLLVQKNEVSKGFWNRSKNEFKIYMAGKKKNPILMDFWVENVVIWCWNDVFQSDTQESVALLWPRDRSKWLSNALQRKFWASFRCTCTNHTSTQWEGGKAKNAPILDAQFWMVIAGVSKKNAA